MGIRMRHDAHYVEELASQRPTPIGRFVPIDALDPNPEQPRIEFGDLTELADSIKEKGVLEPLLIKPSVATGRWMIIAGERRWRASQFAGLREVPCIEMDIDDRAVAEIALIENMQRKDLTAWEEADGLAALCERFGYTHEEAARKVGKSRSTVTEALSIATLPEDIRVKCRQFDIGAKSVLLQVVRQPDEDSMRRLINDISKKGLKRDGVRAARRIQQSGFVSKPDIVELPYLEPYVFQYESSEKQFLVSVKIMHSDAKPQQVIDALQSALNYIRSSINSSKKN